MNLQLLKQVTKRATSRQIHTSPAAPRDPHSLISSCSRKTYCGLHFLSYLTLNGDKYLLLQLSFHQSHLLCQRHNASRRTLGTHQPSRPGKQIHGKYLTSHTESTQLSLSPGIKQKPKIRNSHPTETKLEITTQTPNPGYLNISRERQLITIKTGHLHGAQLPFGGRH